VSLAETLRARIAAEGPLRLDVWMAACNAAYYGGKDPLGRDFTTAPEISQMFGELIGAFSGARLDTTSIFRRKMTERHRLGMGFDERLRSMRDAFGVSAPRLIRDRRLLLIDDVLTTGSTADEAARTLLDSGAREVSLLTISRANYRANSLI
jgi:predicted amidophosphoribosyltransferase